MSSSSSFWDIDGNGKVDFDEGLFWIGIGSAIVEDDARAARAERERDREERARDLEARERRSSYYYDDDDDDDDYDYDDDDYGYGHRGKYDICDVDWDDHDEVMEAIESGKYSISDLETMLDNVTGIDFRFTEDEYEEICDLIRDERVKSHLYWSCREDTRFPIDNYRV